MAGSRSESKSPVDVTSAFAEITYVRVLSFRFERFTVRVGDEECGCDRLAGCVIQDAAFDAFKAPALPGSQQHRSEDGSDCGPVDPAGGHRLKARLNAALAKACPTMYHRRMLWLAALLLI